MSKRSAIVIGGGIVGIATARALAIRGYTVTVFERSQKAIGASIRNFGMIWPIGQPDGEMYERASLSRRIWLETCEAAGIWFKQTGSLHLAYEQDELNVLKELQEVYVDRSYKLLTPEQTANLSPAVNPSKLMGGLYSTEEIIVDPRKAIAELPIWLENNFDVSFAWGTSITAINYPNVYSGKKRFSADEIYVCTGEDFETLYPEQFSQLPITRCKLQMMKMAPISRDWQLGPALCGGLSLLHYGSFRAAGSFDLLHKRMSTAYAEFLRLGIHVMVSQNSDGDLIIGDSHEYGLVPEPFNHAYINELILQYLGTFATFSNGRVIESWNGVYPKLTNGQNHVALSPEAGVTIINGLGGAGMTLSFGLCEELIKASR